MSRLIDADALMNVFSKLEFSGDMGDAMEILDNYPTIDAVPISWINKHLEWLDNCDNDFAQLAKVSIRGMLELWRKDGMLNEQTTDKRS